MENLKLTLFNFKKGLSLDQEDISRIVEGYVNNITKFSEKEIIHSLTEQLSIYSFDDKVKSLVEGLGNELKENELLLDLKHLFKKVDRKNYGELHRQPLQVLLNIINESDDQSRMQKIVNELCLYDWVPEIKTFMHQFSTSPTDKENIKNGGNIESVFTVVEKVEQGHVVFINDKWFLLSENAVSFTLLEDHIKDIVKLKQLRVLEQALKIADVNKDKIEFHISEDLTIGIDSSNGKKLYLNNELISEDTSLENIFSSPIVPFLKSDFYPIIKETANNIDKFVDFDVAMRVNNVLNMHAESYVFNYKDKIFNYTCDKRYGNSLFEYDSVMELIGEMKRDYDFDVTYFYQNKLTEEVKKKRNLEDREKEITIYLDEVNENIDVVNSQLQMMKGNDLLEKALNKLLFEKANKQSEILKIRKSKSELDKDKVFVKYKKDDAKVEEGIKDFMSGKSAYKAQAKFLEGSSDEAKKVKKLYSEIVKSKKKLSDPEVKQKALNITKLGAMFARKNKLIEKDYSYSQLKTVLDENYSRAFKGGANLTTGE